jgi:ADP-ribose pyrophosphatase
MTKPWRILDRKVIYSAQPYIELSVETVELPDGRIIPDYHHLHAGNFATIVPETEDGRFIVLRQYRHGVRRVGLALPGGRIDEGEEPLEAAKRELIEEIGATAEAWDLISSWDTSCTYGFTRSWYFHARGVRHVKAPMNDDLEGGEILTLTRGEILQALRDGSFVSLGHAAPLALALLPELTPE